MHNAFYGFKVDPFGETPDTKFYFKGESHGEALSQLQSALAAGKGFILLTGQVGLGKTILSRVLLRSLKGHSPTALILNPTLDVDSLMTAIREEFGIAQNGEASFKNEYDQLGKFLIANAAEGKRAVLIVDEAQRLSPEGLERIRLLSNLETDDRKLLQIVLIGQSELQAKLQDFNLRQLDQRISVRIPLSALSIDEVEFYIKHRIEIAGGTNFVRFDAAACRWIAKQSGGIPRVINAICDRTLALGVYQQRRLITVQAVKAANPAYTNSIWPFSGGAKHV